MKVALISPYNTISAYGLRSISACLKKAGHEVKLIFLPSTYTANYEEKVFAQLIELVKDSRLIGISLMTNYFENAVSLTLNLQRFISAPIIFGGIHPTVRPEECLQYADMICVGEGEETVIELAKKMSEGENYFDTLGMWFKHNGKIIKNNLRPLIQDINSLPFQDYDYESHFLLHENQIQIMNKKLLELYLQNTYSMHPTRGCPYVCSYCCNNVINKLYPKEQSKIVRKRSVENVIQELQIIKNTLPSTKSIIFEDDAFSVHSEEFIAEFSKIYKQKINLPLIIRGVIPSFITRKKVSSLVDAGLIDLRIGVQTGCDFTKHLYRRHQTNEQVENCARIVHEFKSKIPLPKYDIILNNPWETIENLTETLMLFARLSKPYSMNMFSLTFYPGTELYTKAVADGIVKDDLKDVYRKNYNFRADGISGRLLNESYINNLFYLLYIYALEGVEIDTKILSILANKKKYPIVGTILYFALKQRARFFLLKRKIRSIILAKTKGSEIRDGHALDY